MKKPTNRRKALEKSVPDWPDRTVAGLQTQMAAIHPDRPMILTADRAITYREAAEHSRRLASGLIALGLQAGEHVALIMANYPEFVIARLAIARAGAVAVPLNTNLQRGELAYVLAQSDSCFVIGMDRFRHRDYRPDLLALQAARPELRRIIIRGADPGRPGERPDDWLGLHAVPTFATAASDAELARREAAGHGGALSDIVYTSGTTGRAKGVMLTHDMVLRAAYSSALTRAFEDGRRVQFALPMYHVFGYVECFVAALFVGGAIIPHPAFDPFEMLEWAEALGSTDMVCVPVMTRELLNAARQRGFAAGKLAALFNSGGANVPTIWREIRETLGVREIHTAYGMTETTASAVCTIAEDGDECLLHTNGRIKLAGVAGDPAIGNRVAEIRAVDPETGAILPPGRDGELQVRGPLVTRGYYHKPEETREAFAPDGWLRTGDVGCLLEGGHLRLTGRIKEAWRCGGEMVMPREIEDLLADFPGVAQVLAVGVPDPRMGEAGCLCIVPLPGCTPDAAAILAHCAGHLARFKVPRHFLLIGAAEIPLTVTGRPQKFLLARLAQERLGLGA